MFYDTLVRTIHSDCNTDNGLTGSVCEQRTEPSKSALRCPFFGAEHATLHDLDGLEPILLRDRLQVPEVELLHGLILA